MSAPSLTQASATVGSLRADPYDVLSAWPIIGPRANKLAIQDAKLAMAIRGKNKHYRIREIQPRHWHGLAERVGVQGLWQRMIELAESTDRTLEKVTATLPVAFPERVIDKIAAGTGQQVRSFLMGHYGPEQPTPSR